MKIVMRSVVAGLAAVALLVGGGFSAANAVDPVEPSPEVVEQVESETGADEAAVVPDEPGEQETVDPVEPGQDEPGVSSEAPVPVPADVPVVPETVEGGVAPEVLPVTGKIVEVPAEPTMESVEKQEKQRKNKKPRKQKAPKEKPIEEERFELAPEFQPEFEVEADDEDAVEPLEMSPGMTLLATESGQSFPVDEAALSAELVPGARVAAQVVLPVAAQEAVQEVMDETPGEPVATSELVEAAAMAAAESDQLVTLTDEYVVLPAPAAGGVVAVKAHSANVVYFTNNKVSQEANIRGLMTKVSNYWKKESEGKVNGISVNAVKQVAPGALDVCDPDVAWGAAAALFPDTDYFAASQAKHLTVFIDRSCAGHAADAGGWGMGGDALHDGGMNFVNLLYEGQISFEGVPLSSAVHEFGHNFRFSHSNRRSCSAPYSDAAPSNITFKGNFGTDNPGKLCTDVEYSDAWSPLGNSINIASLPFVMKVQAGFLAMPAVVTEKGGNTQRFTLQALSATSGLRGVRVKHTGGSEEFTLEYRNGAGQDAAALRDRSWQKGVRAVKMVMADGFMSTAVYGPGREGVVAGGVLHPYGGRARVTVESMTSSAATVRVDFSTSFTDVLLSDRFSGSIQWMYDNKISTGTRKADNTALYGPKVDVSREAMAAFMFRGYGPATYTPGAKGKLPFTDISTSHPFYKEIYWMWQYGITTGTKQADGSVKYLPSDPLSREAMAAFMFRAEKASYTVPAKSPFVDVPTTSQFYKQISWMYATGISTGTVTASGRVYEPKVNTTREVMAAFIQRASTV